MKKRNSSASDSVFNNKFFLLYVTVEALVLKFTSNSKRKIRLIHKFITKLQKTCTNLIIK